MNGPAPAAAACPASAWDEPSAIAAATTCGARVEVSRLRGEASRVWANPAGNLTVEEYAAPQWVRKDGAWTGVDPTLERGPDGVIRPVAALGGVELGVGGDGTLVSMAAGDGRFGLNWPGPLPSPVLSGPVATYPEVLPGVDLEVQSQIEGFSYTLKVKTREAAANPALAEIKLNTVVEGDLEVAQDDDGVIRLVEPEGEVVAISPGASMWDSPKAKSRTALRSSTPTAGDPAAPSDVAEIPAELSGESLTVKPDLDFLTGPEADFPVYIDPPFNGKTLVWAPIHKEEPEGSWWNDSAWPRDDSMFVGYQGWASDRSTGTWRSMVKIDLAAMGGATLLDVKFKVLLDHSGGCGDTPIDLWAVNAIDKGVKTSWSTWSGKWLTYLAKTSGHANEGGGCPGGVQPDQWLSFSSTKLTDWVQSYASAPYVDLSFGLRAETETDKYQWKRLALNSAFLEITYNFTPEQPTNLTVAPGGQCAGTTLMTSDSTPTLSAKVTDKDGEMRANIEVTGGPTSVPAHVSGVINPDPSGGMTYQWSTPTLAPGTYKWRVRGQNGTYFSPWSPYCSFTVDTTPPSVTPVITMSTTSPQAGVPVAFKLGANGATDATTFAYGIDVDVPQRSVPIVDGAAEVTMDVPSAGGYTLYVWPRDAAGNLGPRANLTFTATAAPSAPQIAGWRLDGVLTEDNADGDATSYDLTAASGWSAGADRRGAAGAAMTTTGSGCAQTTGRVLNSDESFSVAAWAKITDVNGSRVVLSQSDNGKAGFQLRYDASGRWVFEIPRGDAASPSWDRVISATSAKAGVWAHLAAVYDKSEGVIRLYVNGDLQGQTTRTAEPSTDGAFALGCGPGADAFIGSVDEVGAWKGVLTRQAIVSASGNLPGSPLAGSWGLADKNGKDASSAGNNVVFYGDATAALDRSTFEPTGATAFSGLGWARTDKAVIRTDQSFTVSAWVKLENTTNHQTVFAQAAGLRPGVYLKYNPGQSAWGFEIPSADVDQPTWNQVFSDAPPVVGKWTHLAATFDAATGEMRLYVDGERQKAATTITRPGLWNATGPAYIGMAACTSTSEVWSGFIGSIDEVTVWRGALTADQVKTLSNAG